MIEEKIIQINAPFNNRNLERLREYFTSLNHITSGYNHYVQALKMKLDPNTEEGFYSAISIAYSWMPTMLNIYMPEGKSLQDYIQHVLYFNNCSKIDIHRMNEDVRRHFSALVGLINNSVVGTSKVLHILYPKTVPIIDSRVISGWNSFFAADIDRNPSIKLLPSFVSVKPERQMGEYFHYWNMLNKWMRVTGVNNIRELEHPFYLIGKQK